MLSVVRDAHLFFLKTSVSYPSAFVLRDRLRELSVCILAFPILYYIVRKAGNFRG